MRYKIPCLLLALSAGALSPAYAQESVWVVNLLRAAELPLVALDARHEGMTDHEIRGLLGAVRTARIPAYEAIALVDTARMVRRDHGRVDNFGAFVQSQLAAGKRGRELAAAIRAEHARRGQGQPTSRRVTARVRGNAGAARDVGGAARRGDVGSQGNAGRRNTAGAAGNAARRGNETAPQRGARGQGQGKADTTRGRGRPEAKGAGRPANPGASGAPDRRPDEAGRGRGTPDTHR